MTIKKEQVVLHFFWDDIPVRCNTSICIQRIPLTVSSLIHFSFYVFFIVFNRDNQTFAATRPSAVLLEQLAVCVTKGESVLLVGETGTGKTSTVQHLAKVTGEFRNLTQLGLQWVVHSLHGWIPGCSCCLFKHEISCFLLKTSTASILLQIQLLFVWFQDTNCGLWTWTNRVTLLTCWEGKLPTYCS